MKTDGTPVGRGRQRNGLPQRWKTRWQLLCGTNIQNDNGGLFYDKNGSFTNTRPTSSRKNDDVIRWQLSNHRLSARILDTILNSAHSVGRGAAETKLPEAS